MSFGVTSLLIWLGDVLLIIAFVAGACWYYDYLRRRYQEDAADLWQEAAAAAAPRAQPASAAAAVQMAAMAMALLLDHVTYTHQNGGSDDCRHPSVAEQQDCAICLSQFEDGDRCSVMPVCRHEFHRSCIVRWLAACNNTCPLCRAQLRWDVVALDMV